MANPLPKKNKKKQTAANDIGALLTPPVPTKRTYVALVLDSSGSMGRVREDALGGFNTNVETIKANADLGGETYVSFFTFGEGPDSRPRTKFLNQPAASLAPLTRESYKPEGVTPMLDGIGLALSSLATFDGADQDTAFLVTVITDGEENASHEWTGPALSERVKALQANGNWTITLLGANIDLDQLSTLTGINRNQTVSYVSSSLGTQQALAANASASASYFAARATGALRVANMYGAEANLSDAGAVTRLRVKAQADLKKARAPRRRSPDPASV